MCLDVAPGSKARIAEEDIPVYKMVLECGRYYVSFFRKHPFMVEYVHKEYVPFKVISECDIDMRNERHFITRGFHSFATKNDAAQWVTDWLTTGIKMMSHLHPVILAATIPKGSQYMQGTFDGVGSIVSDALMVHAAKEV